MNLSDFVVPLLAFSVAFNTIMEGLKDGFTLRKGVELTLLIFILGFSWWTAFQNAEATDRLNSKIDRLVSRAEKDSSFQKDIKDSFGIISVGGKPIRDTLFIKEKGATVLPHALNPDITLDLSSLPNPSIRFTKNGDSLVYIGIMITKGTMYVDSYRYVVFYQLGNGYSKTPHIINGSYTAVSKIVNPQTLLKHMLYLNQLKNHPSRLLIAIETKYRNGDDKKFPIHRDVVEFDIASNSGGFAPDYLVKQIFH